MSLYERVTQCPECGEHLEREFDKKLEGEELVEYTTCQGTEPHRWRVLSVHRDRSIWSYQLSGPVKKP